MLALFFRETSGFIAGMFWSYHPVIQVEPQVSDPTTCVKRRHASSLVHTFAAWLMENFKSKQSHNLKSSSSRKPVQPHLELPTFLPPCLPLLSDGQLPDQL